MTHTNNPALEPETLYSKSKVYIRRGLRAQNDGELEEYQLWASLALELLGKAALAKVHPALVADPTHYQSLFAACGRHLSSDIKTITAKTLFERLGHIDKAFDARHQKFCEQIALRRNAELHSGESPFSGMSAEAWEREFWGATQTILEMQKESLESWLGAEHAKAPAKIIEQATEAMQWAVRNRVARHKEDFEKKHHDPKRRIQLKEESKNIQWWNFSKNFGISADGHELHDCPACASKGLLAGVEWTEEISDEVSFEDPTLELVDTTYLVEEFFCPTCSLHLFGARETQAAELPEDFIQTAVREREFEPEYGND